MSKSLFTAAELREMHAQIVQLRAETMRLARNEDETTFVPIEHVWQTMAYAFCLVTGVSAITVAAIKYLL